MDDTKAINAENMTNDNCLVGPAIHIPSPVPSLSKLDIVYLYWIQKDIVHLKSKLLCHASILKD